MIVRVMWARYCQNVTTEICVCVCVEGGPRVRGGGGKAVQLLGLTAGQLYCSDSSKAPDVRHESYYCMKNKTKPVFERLRFWN